MTSSNRNRAFSRRGLPLLLQGLLQGAALLLTAQAHAAGSQPTCAAIAGQTGATVIAYEPPSSFTICRGGKEETDVVEGRPIYVEVVSSPGASLLRFRVHGRATEPEATGLRETADRIGGLAAGLRALAASTQTIAEATAGAHEPSGPVDQSRALYLGVVTPRFHEILAEIGEQLDELPPQATMLSRVCAELASSRDGSRLVASELAARCVDPQTAPTAVDKEVAALHTRIDAFRSERDAAREALVAARAKPDDAAAQGRATATLDQARQGAVAVLHHAQRLAPVAASIASEAWLLREVVRGAVGSLTPGVPHYLARFSRNGVASLRIDASPVELLPVGGEARGVPAKDESSATFHFPVVGLHFLDIEAGVGATGGPQVPHVAPGSTVIGGSNVDEFVGLAMIEVEPARFLWPDRPLAGLLRFPVIGVPFTRDPSRNFFGGAGIGWTDVGSICAGPYLFRGLALDSGVSVGQSLPPGQSSIDSVASTQLRLGYFVSASIDLLGLAHVFFRPHEASLDATTGTEAP